MTEEPSASSDALARLKNAQPSAPDAAATPGQEPTPAEKTPATDKVTWHDRFNGWLDSFRGPTQEDIERAIANTPDRIQQRWQKLQDDRRAAREAEEQARLLVLEVQEAKEALESRWERDAQEMARLEREEAAEARRQQQARETIALLQAARELESDDIPAPENRPMLQREGQYLSDEELFLAARENLPEWQRLERIVNKARSIEAQTPPPTPGERLTDGDEDQDIVLPFRKPLTDDPDPEHLDGFRRITLSLSWVLFVAVGLFSLGWVGPWTSLLDAHDGLYQGSTSLLSMAFWHVLAWPLLWIGMALYTGYQWAPSQYAAVRNRTTAWYVSNAMLLAAGTQLLVHFQDWGLEIITALAATALLMRAVKNLNAYTERTPQERFLVDVPIGAFTGWMLIYSATTIFTTMASYGVSDLMLIPEILWAIAMVATLLVVLSKLTLTGRGRMSIAVGFGFGVSAIVGSRIFGDNTSFVLVGLTLLGLFIILAATENRRYQIATAEKRALEHLVYLDDAPTER